MARKNRITRPEAVDLLLEACPTFRAWVDGAPELFTADSWQNNSRAVMATFLNNFARHLLTLQLHQDSDALDAAARAIERLCRDGNASVGRVSMRDFLENVDSIWRSCNVDPSEF